jgi:1-acyl-sn-glycerol-3-phosphate acyltransferase
MCIVHILQGLAICAFVFPFRKRARRLDTVGWWSALLLKRLGIRIESSGEIADGPVLLVANHMSWLDIMAINAVRPARFVSKADVKAWPLIGWLVACGGTLFIERERKRDALRVVHQVAEALRDGDRIAVFPEGTTGNGEALLPFHANLLQAAVGTLMPVQGLAVRYSDASTARSQAVVWIGDTTLVESLWAAAMADGLCVRITALPAQPSAGRDRRELCESIRIGIERVLG